MIPLWVTLAAKKPKYLVVEESISLLQMKINALEAYNLINAS